MLCMLFMFLFSHLDSKNAFTYFSSYIFTFVIIIEKKCKIYCYFMHVLFYVFIRPFGLQKLLMIFSYIILLMHLLITFLLRADEKKTPSLFYFIYFYIYIYHWKKVCIFYVFYFMHILFYVFIRPFGLHKLLMLFFLISYHIAYACFIDVSS